MQPERRAPLALFSHAVDTFRPDLARIAAEEIVDTTRRPGDNVAPFGRVMEHIADAEFAGTPLDMQDNLRLAFSLTCRRLTEIEVGGSVPKAE